ncbi:unnamed protein product [Umbelopsis vinacea]
MEKENPIIAARWKERFEKASKHLERMKSGPTSRNNERNAASTAETEKLTEIYEYDFYDDHDDGDGDDEIYHNVSSMDVVLLDEQRKKTRVA